MSGRISSDSGSDLDLVGFIGSASVGSSGVRVATGFATSTDSLTSPVRGARQRSIVALSGKLQPALDCTSPTLVSKGRCTDVEDGDGSAFEIGEANCVGVSPGRVGPREKRRRMASLSQTADSDFQVNGDCISGMDDLRSGGRPRKRARTQSLSAGSAYSPEVSGIYFAGLEIFDFPKGYNK
ncbi:unnamed protein product [Protopolystoma xenopodis]|uniref:Uncharacterized protein n=1 Tax=Protopolystoma xenopodis TaxID=117903 RepID=A0A448WWD9_9PLAT|nr:unnamed protein product [Protopolystoma xenopodis]